MGLGAAGLAAIGGTDADVICHAQEGLLKEDRLTIALSVDAGLSGTSGSPWPSSSRYIQSSRSSSAGSDRWTFKTSYIVVSVA